MARIIMDVSMSLDGFAAGPSVGPAAPMGEGGERLHDWMFSAGPGPGPDGDARRAVDAAVGAVLVGRRTFDIGVDLWGGTPWAATPSFVVTHRPQPDFAAANGGMFHFDGLEAAARRARAAAGGTDVMVLGPGLGRSLLRAGLLDEIWLHVVPILLGGGTRLFDGEAAEFIPDREPVAGRATHLRFRVARPAAPA